MSLPTKDVLVDESIICIDWFKNNKMQANQDKFQAIMLGLQGFLNCKSLNLNGLEIKCEDSVKLLGVTFDFMLNFDIHMSNICKKSNRKAMNRNWSNQKANPALKTKTGNK